MIGFLRGALAGRAAEGCFVEVGGVGYRLACSATTLSALPSEGEAVSLWTHLHVREDALTLYGFSTEAEHGMFEALLTVAGIGPRVAQALCSALPPGAFHRALAGDDVDTLASVPGIGRKTAQRLLIDLKEKLVPDGLSVVLAQPDSLAKARSALENLGYGPAEIRAALAVAATDAGDDVEEVIKSALQVLA